KSAGWPRQNFSRFCPAVGGTSRRESIRFCQCLRKGVGGKPSRKNARQKGGRGRKENVEPDRRKNKKRQEVLPPALPVCLRSLANVGELRRDPPKRLRREGGPFCLKPLLPRARRPGDALISSRHRSEAFVGELLHAPALIGFRRIEIAFRV